MTVRTRFAPSPTGFMHLGGLRTALYNWLYARKTGGKFILRIEDTDQARFVEGATQVIYDTLKGCGIDWDEGPDVGGPCGPYVQSDRRDLYLPYAQQLVESGHAYYCFCTKEELDERRAAAEARGETFKYDKHCLHLSKEEVQAKLDAGIPWVIRQNVPTEGETTYTDLVFGTITMPNENLDDMVLIKADGMPTYNFANVIDDHLMGITHIMRGMEYLSSTPKYNLLYEAFGWEVPTYAHLTTVMRDASHKLSKRDGDAYYSDYVEKGYLTEALLNYLALVGWNPGDEREFFTLSELVDAFDLSGLSRSPGIFDVEKLRWFNASYIRRMDCGTFTANAMPWYEKAGVAGMDHEILYAILQPRLEVFGELPEMVDFLANRLPLSADLFVNKKSKCDVEVSRTVLSETIPLLEGLPEWTQQSVHDCLIGYAEASGRKNGTVLWPVRIGMSGKTVTPGGAIEIACLLGREEALSRLHSALDLLAAV